MSNIGTTRKPDNSRILLDIVASKWAVPVVDVLLAGTKRFNEIQKALPNTTQKVLTETLRRLERNGMLERTSYPTVPPQVEYTLTPLGNGLSDISKTMISWVEKHSADIQRSQKAYDKHLNSK